MLTLCTLVLEWVGGTVDMINFTFFIQFWQPLHGLSHYISKGSVSHINGVVRNCTNCMSLIIIIVELCEHVKRVLLVKIFPCWRAPLCQMLGSDKIYSKMSGILTPSSSPLPLGCH